VTDVSNASRTMVFDIHRAAWDDELLAALDLPRSLFPSPVRCSGVVAETEPAVFGAAVPIAGLAGDQQAALFGQGCFAAGEAKNTYGTGCFLLANTGDTPRIDGGGLLATIAWDIGAGRRYALEGSAFVTGAAVQWLRDGLGVIRDAGETEALARSVPSGDGLYLVPAFTGLAFQTRDLVEAMRAAGQPIEVLRVDGGGTANAFLMQLQSDLLGLPVEVAAARETTALGAAFLAGLGVGVWASTDELAGHRAIAARFEPAMAGDERDSRYAGWLRAVERSRGWANPSGPAPASST